MNFSFSQITNQTKIRYAFLAVFFVAIAIFGFNKIQNAADAANCPGAASSTPVFNVWPIDYGGSACHDLPMVDAKVLNGTGRDARYATSQAEHDAGINIAAGNQVRVSVYFHNGASPDDQTTATAHNVTIAVNPSIFNNPSTQFNLDASISASNASTVTSAASSRGGDLQLHSTNPVSLQYVSGTTQMCIKQAAAVERKNAGQNVDLTQTCGTDSDGNPQVLINLPDGIVNGGVSIGDLPACFPYSGTLIFTANVVGQTNSNTSIQDTKTVRDITAGSLSGVSATKADAGDMVEFHVDVANTGSAVANNVLTKDTMPAGLTLVPGSVSITSGNGSATSDNNDILVNNSGIVISQIQPNSVASFTYRATVTATSSATLVNSVTSQGSNTNSSTSQASVVVNVNQLPPPPSNTTIQDTKSVENITAGAVESYSASTKATTGDTVQFKVTAQNTGAVTATNVNTKDTLPAGLAFIPGSVVNLGSGSAASDSLVSNGINAASLPTGASVGFTFRATVTATSSTTLTNTITSQGSNTNTSSATASVVVTVNQLPPPPSTTTISVSKFVRNATTGNSFSPSTSARNGDTAEFQVTIANTGSVAANNVVVRDTLPSGLSFSSGSVTATNPSRNLDDSIVSTGGFTLSSLAVGQSVSFDFKTLVTISNGTLTNTVIAQGSNTNSGSAQATVNVTTPVIPTNANITLTKVVRNNTRGDLSFAPAITARNGDDVEFKITIVNNDTSVTAQNVNVTDQLPQGLSFDVGTGNINVVSGNGSNIGNILPGASAVVDFTATVGINSGVLTNIATAVGSNTNSTSGQATVTVSTPVVPTNTTIKVTKLVSNPSENLNTPGPSVSAKSGDTVNFTIAVTNTGSNTAKNVFLTDALPSGLTQLNANTSMFTSTGISLGDIAAGQSVTVTFQAKVTLNSGTAINVATAQGSNTNTATDSAQVLVTTPPPVNYSLTVTKQLRDVTSGQTGYVNSTNAIKGDSIQYKIVVTNTGSGDLTNVKITDNLSGNLQLQSNSFGISIPGNNSSMGNIVITTLPAGQSVTINFTATAAVDCVTVNNTVTVNADQISSVQSNTAVVNVVCNQAPQNGTLSIDKVVKDLTSGTSFQKTVAANPGDRLAYQITVIAHGGTVSNVTLTDTLPSSSYFTYSSGSALFNNNAFANTFTTQNVNIGSLADGQAAVVYFEGTVASNMPVGQTTLINTASASGDHLGTVTSEADVTVSVSAPNNTFPQLQITKLVRNNTNSSANICSTGSVSGAYCQSTNAAVNDIVTFQIALTNTGTQTLNNVYVSDILPSGLSFRPGTVRLDGNTVSDGLTSGRFTIGNMTPNQQHLITFDAQVQSIGTGNNNATLINTAQAGADNFSQIQASASVLVSQVQGTFVSINQSKRANNDTQGIDATAVPANPNDFITYTLMLNNTGNAPATNYTMSDDLTQVLNYATMVDPEGGFLNGNVISWSGITVPAYGSISKSFRVQVRSSLPAGGSYTLVNSFGNTVVIYLRTPQNPIVYIQQPPVQQVLGATFVAPTTGPDADYAFLFAGMVTAGFAILKKKGLLTSVLAKIKR